MKNTYNFVEYIFNTFLILVVVDITWIFIELVLYKEVVMRGSDSIMAVLFALILGHFISKN